ncbi:unnamed protein product [Phytomonas sp. EM1]|nr:unnamed protein product [Phytomonas sp. EM1]|eukprot:CCW60379.1 unnamed protein product [Phytomonas sp. isolate EM1]
MMGYACVLYDCVQMSVEANESPSFCRASKILVFDTLASVAFTERIKKDRVMLGISIRLTRSIGHRPGVKVPNPGSSLLNPLSQRSRLRKAMNTYQRNKENFEQHALFANPGVSASTGSKDRFAQRLHPTQNVSNSKNMSDKRKHRALLLGQSVAEQSKHMTDNEWEAVPMEEKHAFTKYMSKLLKEHPTEATEQQRRRYFETTMLDPRDLNPNRTVRDEYERIKIGLPVQLKNPQRSMGLSQAIYEAGDASLFEPENVHKLEDAMIYTKQVFADYVRKKREGVSTETERRRLANLTADLNVETQKHLSHLFKYAQERLRKMAIEERQAQLKELERLKELVSLHKKVKAHSPNSDTSKKVQSVAKRKAWLTASISKAVGLEVDVMMSLLEELDAQEKFMQFCEVFARLTLGRGFSHTSEDEGLDEYTESLKKLYSVDPKKLGTLDVVQYMAAKEDAHPVEWAKRWYERALLVPLQHTPEYKRLHDIQQIDQEALELKKSLETCEKGQLTSVDGDHASSTIQKFGPKNDKEGGSGHAIALQISQNATKESKDKVTHIVEMMFLRPEDPRLESLHEKRLRYLAYLQLERQIMQARENAKRFVGVELIPEAEECRALYRQLMERKKSICEASDRSDSLSSLSGKMEECSSDQGPNVFAIDPESNAIFQRLHDITLSVIAQYKKRNLTGGKQYQSSVAKRAQKVSQVLEKAMGNHRQSEKASQILADQKHAVTQRLLGILERDVLSEIEWLDAMQEAERPPLLPIPEGMSYTSAADVKAWKGLRDEDVRKGVNPFEKKRRLFQPSLLGQAWNIPDRPLLFWGTGAKVVQQALQHAAEDAERRRRGVPLSPPYPCPENPWGWRLAKDILDD